MEVIFILALCLVQSVVGSPMYTHVENTVAQAEEPFFIQEIRDQVEAPRNYDVDLLGTVQACNYRGKNISKNVQHLTGNPVGSVVTCI